MQKEVGMGHVNIIFDFYTPDPSPPSACKVSAGSGRSEGFQQDTGRKGNAVKRNVIFEFYLPKEQPDRFSARFELSALWASKKQLRGPSDVFSRRTAGIVCATLSSYMLPSPKNLLDRGGGWGRGLKFENLACWLSNKLIRSLNMPLFSR